MSAALMLAFLYSASPVGIPDVKDWQVIMTKQLEFRVDDYRTVFIGRVIEYRNPQDPGEHLRIYRRQVAILSQRALEQGKTGQRTIWDLNYHLKDEHESLDRVQASTDAFAYLRWRIIRDERTDQDIRSGPLEVWLLDQSGRWVRFEDRSIMSRPFSEPSKSDPSRQVLVGIEFSVKGEAAHILRVDQDDVPAPGKEQVDAR